MESRPELFEVNHPFLVWLQTQLYDKLKIEQFVTTIFLGFVQRFRKYL
jgi:hypothetical protein